MLKAIWKFIIAIAETGEAVIPVEMMYDLQNFALEGLMDLGFNVEDMRDSMWDSAGDCYPGKKVDSIPVDEEVFDLKSKSDKELDDMLPGFIQQLGLGKFYVQGTDNGNRPVVYLNVRMHRPGDQNARTMEKMFVYILETEKTDENMHMKDMETKTKLVEEWKALMKRFEALSKEWVTSGT
ncbi:hypothetical protein BGZ75_002340 [Mortierella antarctica]|nr:hypothetical protein BGZ75_002340 [Mortierella antarctica]